MALTITHTFASAVADGADATLVRPSNWNASHTLSGAVDYSELTGSPATPFTLALGTITSNVKALNITGTWNASGVTFDAPLFMNITNTASGAGSLLADFQVGSASLFTINAKGAPTIFVGATGGIGSNVLASILNNGGTLYGLGVGSTASLLLFSNGFTISFEQAAAGQVGLYNLSGQWFAWFSSTYGSGRDTGIIRAGAAGAIALASPGAPTTTPTAFYAYNTVDTPTGPTNYERGVFGWQTTTNVARAVFGWQTTTNVLTIGTQAGGTGTLRNVNALGTWIFQGAGTGFSAPLQINGAGWFQLQNTDGGCLAFNNSNGAWITFSNLKLMIGAGAFLGFTSAGSGTTADTGLSRSAAGVLAFGNGSAGDASACILAKTKAGAPTTSDVPAGTWVLIRDTTNSTTKLYYNNAGTLMTVALT